MYLVDTNIWLELLLEQTNADEVKQFLEQIPLALLSSTDFTLLSIGIIAVREEKQEGYLKFVDDLLVKGALSTIRLNPRDLPSVLRTANSYKLDFDDAYQYVANEKQNLQLVSFDKDFDKTPRGRKTPAQILATLK